MFRKIFNYYLLDFQAWQHINIAVARGGAMMTARRIDLTQPATWEFCGFSQNGEDGVLDVLRSQLPTSNRFFVEIGAGDGRENNTSWLAVMEKQNGIMIEGNGWLAGRANRTVIPMCIGVECLNTFVETDNIDTLRARMLHLDPDVFSIDIDGNDYYIAKAVLEQGIRPRIFVVEYNSVYGPERSMTIKHRQSFSYMEGDAGNLYYGVSLAGWKKFFKQNDYEFVTVERCGVNAFFVDKNVFPAEFLANVKALEFASNRFQQKKFQLSDEDQFKLVAEHEFEDI